MLYAAGIEQGELIANPEPRFGEPEQGAAGVGGVGGAGYQAEPDEPGQLERDGGRGDPEPAGQLARGEGAAAVEVFEDPGEVGAQAGRAGGVLHRAAPAGGEYQGDGADDPAGLAGGGHRRKLAKII